MSDAHLTDDALQGGAPRGAVRTDPGPGSASTTTPAGSCRDPKTGRWLAGAARGPHPARVLSRRTRYGKVVRELVLQVAGPGRRATATQRALIEAAALSDYAYDQALASHDAARTPLSRKRAQRRLDEAQRRRALAHVRVQALVTQDPKPESRSLMTAILARGPAK